MFVIIIIIIGIYSAITTNKTIQQYKQYFQISNKSKAITVIRRPAAPHLVVNK